MKRFITTVAMSALVVSGFAATGTGKVEAASVTKVKVTDNGLRVRTAPSTNASIVGKVNAGQTYTYKGKSGSWTKISYKGKTRYVSSSYVKTYKTSTATKAYTTSGTSGKRANILKEAAKHKGTPYVWGGTTTRGFDCSGYTSYVYKKAAGKTLPRTSSAQYSSAKKVSVSKVQQGDLVFFSHGSGIQHVGIATSKSSMINSETGGVKYSSFKSGYWGSRLVGAGSYL
ncbi:C40 family peptidase [Exiguobacterium flavidum]|uniref:C40 family peptidase n=1 Tax=Exiguobacterium flavidum TaxID=2184695 RepID=UPI000DF77272|nr:NlpC/P60 family protein [Exiguobacterium flavidum]